VAGDDYSLQKSISASCIRLTASGNFANLAKDDFGSGIVFVVIKSMIFRIAHNLYVIFAYGLMHNIKI